MILTMHVSMQKVWYVRSVYVKQLIAGWEESVP
jgi:hypothetical protein